MHIKLSADRILATIPCLRGVQPGLIDSIVQGADATLPPPPAQVAADLADLLWDLDVLQSPIGDLVPSSVGWQEEELLVASVPSVVAHRLREYTDMSWSSLLALRPVDITNWRNTGPRKAKALLAFVLERALTSEARSSNAPAFGATLEQSRIPSRQQAIDALAVIGAWATARRFNGGLTEVLRQLESLQDPPTDAVSVLEQLPADVFSDDVHRLRFDPDAAADHLLARFDDRERDILTRVLAVDPQDKRTLEEIGEIHGVTRERIRQIESKARSKLEQFLHLPEVRAFSDRARDLRTQVGRACPLSELPTELRPTTESLRDELYAWAAGPYRLDDSWLVADDVPRPLAKWVGTLVETIAPETGIVERDALADALTSEGILPAHHDALLKLSRGVRVLDDFVIRWTGSIGDKAETVLRARDVPMDIEDLCEVIGEGHSVGTLRNALTESRFTRRTKSSYGLAAWGGDEYTNIVSLMRAEIDRAGGSINLEALRKDLADRFAISENSPVLLAQTSPLFIMEGGAVRLRRSDEPYVPSGSLELTQRCFVVEGAWAWTLPINHDVLRGSGFSIPETFAVHLGLQPGDRGSMSTETGSIRVAWGNQNPYIGSLRRIVEDFDGGEGDLLFVRRGTPTSLDFRLVRADDLAYARPGAELLLRVGAAPSSSDVIAAVGSAIGLGGAVRPQQPVLEARLRERKEQHLVELLVQAIRESRAHSD